MFVFLIRSIFVHKTIQALRWHLFLAFFFSFAPFHRRFDVLIFCILFMFKFLCMTLCIHCTYNFDLPLMTTGHLFFLLFTVRSTIWILRKAQPFVKRSSLQSNWKHFVFEVPNEIDATNSIDRRQMPIYLSEFTSIIQILYSWLSGINIQLGSHSRFSNLKYCSSFSLCAHRQNTFETCYICVSISMSIL